LANPWLGTVRVRTPVAGTYAALVAVNSESPISRTVRDLPDA
jgi:hypothetical protein